MRKIFSLIIICAVTILVGCNKEPLKSPSADFTTNLQNNTIPIKQSFVLYLDNVEGEFLTYFMGDKENTTYSPDNPKAKGEFISDNEVDSVIVPGYNEEGVFKFTLVAASSGNWGEDYEKTTKSIDITVTANK